MYDSYKPFWKTDILCRGNVRPSVRLRFPAFFQRALRYQFETWYRHSVGGTTYWVLVSSQLGSVWPSLQPKVGQTYFLKSWPINQIRYIGGPLDTSRHKFPFCRNHLFLILATSFARFRFFLVSWHFSTCFEISIWNLVYTSNRWCHTSSSSFISIGIFWSTL